MNAQASLFDPAPVKDVLDAMESKHAAFLIRVRSLVAGHYAGSGAVISTDEVWRIMDRYQIALPEGASHNLMGTFFSGWSLAEATGNTVRSKRPGANGNLLMTWRIR